MRYKKVYNLEDFRKETINKLRQGITDSEIKAWLRKKCPWHASMIVNNFLKEVKDDL